MTERLGDFAIEGVLGEGGSAIVYAAHEVRQGLPGDPGDRPTEIALKVLRPELTLSEREVAAFLAEAERVRRVTHPSLVAIRGAGILPDGRPYLAMPRLRGECLAERIARGPMALETALRLFQGLAQAVAALHAAGLVHRDIKPENVFVVGAEEHLVLLDLGIARDLHAPASTTTQAGLVRGTPAYMAPERFFGARASILTDTYEVAVVLYAMLTARLPWDHAQEARGRMSPRDPRSSVPLPEAVAQALLRALSVDETARPQGVRALWEELEQAAFSSANTLVTPVLQGSPAGATPVQATPMQATPMQASRTAAGTPGVAAPVVWVAPTLASPVGAGVRALSAPPPGMGEGDIATQDTIALSTGRLRRRGPPWAPAVFAACVIVGAAAGAWAFLLPRAPESGDGTRGGASSAPAGINEARGGANEVILAGTMTQATSGEPAKPAVPDASLAASGAAIASSTAAGSLPGASAAPGSAPGTTPQALQPASGAVQPDSRDVVGGPGHGVASTGGAAGGASATSGTATTSVAPAVAAAPAPVGAGGIASASASTAPAGAGALKLPQCNALLAIYCRTDFQATDGGTTCRAWQSIVQGYMRRPQSEWANADQGCQSARAGALLALTERKRQMALGKHP